MSLETARAFELTMRAALMDSLGMRSVYCLEESVERVLPAIVLHAEYQEDDYALRISGRYAETIVFRASAQVSRSGPDSARELVTLSNRLRDAIETASIAGGWNYIRLVRTGDDRVVDDTKREYTHIYTVTAHPII